MKHRTINFHFRYGIPGGGDARFQTRPSFAAVERWDRLALEAELRWRRGMQVLPSSSFLWVSFSYMNYCARSRVRLIRFLE